MDEKLSLDHATKDHAPVAPQWWKRIGAVNITTLITGTTIVRYTLTRAPGSRAFTFGAASSAFVWFLGGEISDRVTNRSDTTTSRWDLRGAVAAAISGSVLGFFFMLVAPVARRLPLFARWIEKVLQHRGQGDGPVVLFLAVIAGVAEERFFRGPLYDRVGSNNCQKNLISTGIYTVATAGTGNPALAAAGALLGFVTALFRRDSSSVVPAMMVHAVWSVTMFFGFPAYKEATETHSDQ